MVPWVHAPVAFTLGEGDAWSWFQVLFLLGWFLGSLIARQRMRRLGLDGSVGSGLVLAVGVMGLFGAHAMTVLLWEAGPFWGQACEPGGWCDTQQAPCVEGWCRGRWSVLWEVFNGQLTAGAELGVMVVLAGAAGLVPHVHAQWVRWLAALLWIPMMAFWFSSVGCWVANDHLTYAVWHPLASLYPDGAIPGVPPDPRVGPPGYTPRVNIGFMHFAVLSAIMVLPVAHSLTRRPWPVHVMVYLWLLLYGVARFAGSLHYALDLPHAEPRWGAWGSFPGFHMDFFVAQAHWLAAAGVACRGMRGRQG
jgi:hypothetical protein